MPDTALLLHSTLFSSLSETQLKEALALLCAHEKHHARGETLKNALDPMSAFGFVLDGAISVQMDSVDGRQMLLSLVTKGQTFGESLCYLQENAPIYITAAENARVLWLRCDALRQAPQTPLQATLQQRFTAMLCRRTLLMNDRIQILSRASIREKLNAFFTECVRDQGTTSFAIPFNRAEMAAYLGVDRSALSRLLAALKKEGRIRYHKNHFELL